MCSFYTWPHWLLGMFRVLQTNVLVCIFFKKSVQGTGDNELVEKWKHHRSSHKFSEGRWGNFLHRSFHVTPNFVNVTSLSASSAISAFEAWTRLMAMPGCFWMLFMLSYYMIVKGLNVLWFALFHFCLPISIFSSLLSWEIKYFSFFGNKATALLEKDVFFCHAFLLHPWGQLLWQVILWWHRSWLRSSRDTAINCRDREGMPGPSWPPSMPPRWSGPHHVQSGCIRRHKPASKDPTKQRSRLLLPNIMSLCSVCLVGSSAAQA